MPDSTFTFRVDEELKNAFATVADSQERTAAQLLRALMRETVEGEYNRRRHDEWFRGEVERALLEADDDGVTPVDDETVRTHWQRQRAEFQRQANRQDA